MSRRVLSVSVGKIQSPIRRRIRQLADVESAKEDIRLVVLQRFTWTLG
ncbi:MAG TPA: hypothetical protein VJ184_06815 [Chryseolinea sp.]|nr:hypothetical protein [Chryseolinea sp.]